MDKDDVAKGAVKAQGKLVAAKGLGRMQMLANGKIGIAGQARDDLRDVADAAKRK